MIAILVVLVTAVMLWRRSVRARNPVDEGFDRGEKYGFN